MNDNTSNNVVEPLFRCAIYIRGASNLQGSGSLDYQDRICREAIASQGMVVEEPFVRGDVRTSGTPLRVREELNSLIAAANNHPRPFDYIVMADTDRLGRNFRDIFEVYQTLKQLGVNLYFVSQQLDTRVNNHFEITMAVCNMFEEAELDCHRKASVAGRDKKKK